MKNYLLVHGAWHGAWAWEETKRSLEAHGHHVIVIDLPGHGSDTTPISGISFRGYVEAVKAQTDQFIAVLKTMGPLKEGSVITLDFSEGATNVGLNGAAKGSVAGEPFNRALTRIWVGDKPVQSDLRKAMLGA